MAIASMVVKDPRYESMSGSNVVSMTCDMGIAGCQILLVSDDANSTIRLDGRYVTAASLPQALCSALPICLWQSRLDGPKTDNW